MRTYYDREPEKKVYKIGRGLYRYVYDIKEETVKRFEEEQAFTQWTAEEVTFSGAVTSNNITQAVIASKWSSDYEQKLINEYNAAKLGLYDEETVAAKVSAYEKFLAERIAIKAQIDADCEELGIK